MSDSKCVNFDVVALLGRKYYQQSWKKDLLTLLCSRTRLMLILRSLKKCHTSALVLHCNPQK